MELKGAKKSIFEEIAEQYKQYISLGVVSDGEKLPSCRELALKLGINPNTVERAYSLLESEGYAVTLPKKGTYAVSKRIAKEDLMAEAKKQLEGFRMANLTYDELKSLLDTIYEER